MSLSESSLNRFLHAIADPTRRRILKALKECEPSPERAALCATDIERHIRVSQPTVSHHMAILKKAGLIEVKKKGLWRWYQRNDKHIAGMMKALKDSL